MIPIPECLRIMFLFYVCACVYVWCLVLEGGGLGLLGIWRLDGVLGRWGRECMVIGGWGG